MIFKQQKNYLTLENNGIDTFLAPLSITPGYKWSDEILDNLFDSSVVIFLASKNSCKSPYVQQELGVAIGQDKWIVPILLDISFSELPGWMKEYQAIDFSTGDFNSLKPIIQKIIIKSGIKEFAKFLGVFALIWFIFKED